MPKRSKSSTRWLERQKRDYFVRQAQDNGQVSRAHYKLLQIDQRFKLIKPQSKVLELGAAPGGWTNYLESRVSKGLLIAVDPLPITAGLETQVIEGCVGDDAVNDEIVAILAAAGAGGSSARLDLVLSDMAPNISGVRVVDQARSMDQADLTLSAARQWLKKGGAMALKAFQGEGLDDWVKSLRGEFTKVTMTKPKASRADSREVFVVALGFERKI
jgi:23S rRNA (uridine2552-2'-O)-methyltransferase